MLKSLICAALTSKVPAEHMPQRSSGKMSRKRFVELDALRAFAVLLVIWVHSTNIDIGLTGYHGVLLFFVISGFLITGILLDARAAATESSKSYWSVLRAFY